MRDNTVAQNGTMTLQEYRVKFKDGTAITIWSETIEVKDDVFLFSVLMDNEPFTVVLLQRENVASISFEKSLMVDRQEPQTKWGYYHKFRYGKNKIVYFWTTMNIGDEMTIADFYTRGEQYGFYSLKSFMYEEKKVTKYYKKLSRKEKKHLDDAVDLVF